MIFYGHFRDRNFRRTFFFSLYEFILKDVNKSKKVKWSLYSRGKKKENKKKNIQIGT